MNRRERETSARLRTFVGLFAGFVFLIAGALNTGADEPAPPLKIVIANTAEYDTAILLTPKDGATETATGEISNCGGSIGGYGYSLEPGYDAAYEADLPSFLCGPGSFELLDAPTNVDALTIVSYRSDVARSSFAVPPIGAVTTERPSVVGPLINVGDVHAYITTFASEPTPLRATIFGGVYLYLPAIEDFTANEQVKVTDENGQDVWVTPPVSQYALQASGVYFVAVSIRPSKFGPAPVPTPIYGFASDGDLQGGTFRAFAFGK